MRSAITTITLYSSAGVIGLLVLGWVYHLWDADLRVPLYYRLGGDADFSLLLIKSIMDTGWCLTNPYLGAPGTMDLRDYPIVVDNLAYLTCKALATVTHELGLISNLVFLGGFLLCVWSSLFVLRHFGVSAPVALAASLLFAFLPYHFWRGTWHFFLALYYPIPLVVMVALWLCRGEPLFFPRSVRGSGRGTRLSGKGVASLMIIALMSMAGVYYAFFSGFFVLISGLIAVLRRPRWSRALNAGVLLAVLTVCCGIESLPFVLHSIRHGRNRSAFPRSASEAHAYGLYISQLLQPTVGHRLTPLRIAEKRRGAFLVEDWEGRNLKVPPSQLWFGLSPNFSEVHGGSLGMIGAAGFLLLLGVVLGGETAWIRRRRPLSLLAQLNLAAVLLGTAGGFGGILAVVALPQVRCYNRISIFIAFFALFAMALVADRIGRVWGRQGHTRPLFLLGVGLMTLGGLLDEIPAAIPRNPRRELQVFEIDRRYVSRIEAAVAAGSRIFQLPDGPFPEGLPIKFDPFHHIKPYLHSHHLHWSIGAVEGRATSRWQHGIAALPTAEMVPKLVEAGFVGLHIDRTGYPDRGAALTAELDRLVQRPVIESEDGEWVFYPLAPGWR